MTHELLAQLIEEVGLMNTEPRRVREIPVLIERPWDSINAALQRARSGGSAAPPEPSDEPVTNASGGVTATGAVAVMKAMGAIRHVPTPPADAAVAAEGGGVSE
jgi:hypothetical protein